MSNGDFFDIAIVGGGPVGAALGALLVRGAAGRRRVLLLERERMGQVYGSGAQKFSKVVYTGTYYLV